jgi:hypothetical protein
MSLRRTFSQIQSGYRTANGHCLSFALLVAELEVNAILFPFRKYFNNSDLRVNLRSPDSKTTPRPDEIEPREP